MRHILQKQLKDATTLNEASLRITSLFKKMKTLEGGVKRIGYVSGVITSDGSKYIHRNISRLVRYTNLVRKQQSFPIFSATDIFTDNVYGRLQEMKLSSLEREDKFHIFWREILSCGYVTDIFMTPRWEQSRGATDEYETAKRIGIKIHYVEKQKLSSAQTTVEKNQSPNILLA